MELESDLQAEIAAEYAKPDHFQPECPDMDTVQRYQRVYGRIQYQIARVQDAAKKQLERLESELRTHKFMHSFEAEQAARRLIGDGRKRSIITIWGQVGFRKQPVRLEVVDESEVQDRYKVQHVYEKIDKEAMNKDFRETGELPQGCSLTGGQDKFYVE